MAEKEVLSAGRRWVALAASGLLVLGLGVGVYVPGGWPARWPGRGGQPASEAESMASARLATVTIRVTLFRSGTLDGEGFLIDRRGVVLTSANLLRRATSAQVIDSRGMSGDAYLIGLDTAAGVGELLAPSQLGGTPLALASGRVVVGAQVLVPGSPALAEPGRTRAVVGAGLDATVAGHAYGGLLQLDASSGTGSGGAPVLDQAGRVVAVVIAGSPATDSSFAVPVQPVEAELAAWGTRRSTIPFGPSLVAADPKTLVLQVAEVPAGFQPTDASDRSTDVVPAWSAIYTLPPSDANGRTLQTFVAVEASQAAAESAYSFYVHAAADAGYVGTDVTVSLGDQAVLNEKHYPATTGSGTIQRYQVVWRERNTVAIVELAVFAGDAGPDAALHLAGRQEARMSADLASF